MAASEAHAAIDAVWRIEAAKVIAGLARIVGDVGLAEELAQDALVAALEQWPGAGVPRNPGAWLMATAKHRAIDHFRRRERLDRKLSELGHELATQAEGPDFDAASTDDINDDLLRLMFTACHPVLPTEARVARCGCSAGCGPRRSRVRSWPRSWTRRRSQRGRCADVGTSLAGYHLLPAVRADLLAKLGRVEEARVEFERAASLTRNGRERTLLLARAAECGPAQQPT